MDQECSDFIFISPNNCAIFSFFHVTPSLFINLTISVVLTVSYLLIIVVSFFFHFRLAAATAQFLSDVHRPRDENETRFMSCMCRVKVQFCHKRSNTDQKAIEVDHRGTWTKWRAHWPTRQHLSQPKGSLGQLEGMWAPQVSLWWVIRGKWSKEVSH